MAKELILPADFTQISVDEAYQKVPTNALFSIYYENINYSAFRKGNHFFPVQGSKAAQTLGKKVPICKVTKAQLIAIKLLTSPKA
jgi:hypothetical protein